MDSAGNLNYNPSTNVLTSSSFSGALTGNVTGNCTGSSGSCTGNAASSDTIDTTSTNNNSTNYVTFVDSSGTQSGETLRTYTNLTFNPSTGVLSDGKGNVRSIPQNSTTGSYTLVAADASKHVLATGTVTIPNSVFSAGDAVTIINNSGSDITLTASVGTLYKTDDAATGNRTLAGRGMASMIFSSATVAYISGAGLS